MATWNVRTMYNTGTASSIAREMNNYKIEILGLSETRWLQAGETVLNTGEKILYSGHMDENEIHSEGVAFMLSKTAQKALLKWEPVNSRIITATFNTSNKRLKVKMIQCYAPTNDADQDKKERFYEQLQSVMNHRSERDILVMMGDFNAKIGSNNAGYEPYMGKHGLGNMNDNGELLVNFCADNKLVIGGSIFPHKTVHKVTWKSPDGFTENQIDHICISKEFRRSVIDVRVKRGADVGTDHHLLIMKLRLKLKSIQNNKDSDRIKFNIVKLQDPKVKQSFSIALRNRFDTLTNEHEDTEVNLTNLDNLWKKSKEAWMNTAKEVLGRQTRSHKAWINTETLQLIEDRKKAKHKLNCARTRNENKKAQLEYNQKHKEVKKSARRDKRQYYEDLAAQAEEASCKGNMKRLYDITKQLAGKWKHSSQHVKDKHGKTLTTETEQVERWAEHFKELLNRPSPTEKADISQPTEVLDINIDIPTKEEIRTAITKLNKGKAAGPDGINAEILKADLDASTNAMYDLISKIWEIEQIPKDWKEGHIIKLPKKGDLRECKNYRGITLLSVPGKVLSRILLDRIKVLVDEKLKRKPSWIPQ